jgi:plasmid stabilization system protein ParE
MRIEFNPNFINHFLDIWHYIADESTAAANNFEVQLRKKINTLPHFPYKFRASLYYKDENIRDYVFKGYTIPYLIDEENDVLVILDIFKWVDK